jgi:two-component system chemotaxis response regulator CheB
MKNKKIKLLIVDDSMLIRAMFSEMLKHEPDIEIVGTAVDPFDAREKIKQLNPDVITLDVEMPKMDGISFLEKIMALRPMPVVMISSLTARGADITLRALEVGAVDYLTKPQNQTEITLLALKEELAEKIRNAASTRANIRATAAPVSKQPATLQFKGDAKRTLIAIGSSTGGVEALRDVLLALPAAMPPIVITQHMPAQFTASFAARLDKICALGVHEAKHLQKLEPGHVYIAPGDTHMEVHGSIGNWIVHVLRDGPAVSGHKPSVDVLFRSVAKHAGDHAVGVILTGMGRDGAEGLLKMREAGARTLGQNEASCVVYGMPRVAKSIGAVEEEMNLTTIPAGIVRLSEKVG